MPTQLGFLSSTPLQKLAQSHDDKLAAITPNAGSACMWNSNQQPPGNHDNDDSWEVRAFEQDTNNALGATWPPRSYTCTFCTREFRSAQALGGHMNVHRRDRARLLQTTPPPCSAVTASTAAVIMKSNYHQELVANGGVCLIYSLTNPNAVSSPSTLNHSVSSSKILPAVLPSTTNFMLPKYLPPSSIDFPVQPSVNSSLGHSSITDQYSTSAVDDNFNEDCLIHNKKDWCEIEVDLELRLGRGSRPW